MNGLRVAFRLAMRQLLARWRINASAILGVALGVLVLIAMTGVMQGFQQEFLSQLLRVAPHVRVLATEPDEPRPLLERVGEAPTAVALRHGRSSGRDVRIVGPTDLAARIAELPDVEAVCPGIEGQTMAASSTEDAGAVLVGVEPQTQDRCTPLSRYVTAGSWSALQSGRDRCALGVGLAESLGVTVRDRIRVTTASGESETLLIAALVHTELPALDDVRIYVPLRTAQGILGRPDIVGHLDVRIRDPFAADETARRIEDGVPYEVQGWREANESMLGLFDLQNGITNLVILAILLVGGFGILAIQVMMVLQKRRDIAILRAIGLRRGDIVLSFLLQGLLVAVAGALLGDMGGALLLDLLRELPVTTGGDLVDSSGFLIYEDPRVYAWGLVFGSLLGTLASILPAMRAAAVRPVDVLRGQVG